MHKSFIGVVVIFSFFLFPCCNKSNGNTGRVPEMNPQDTHRIVRTVNGTKIVLLEGDITKLKFDPDQNAAIVNAANMYLAEGGGVCKAIFEAADPDLLYKFILSLGNFPGHTVKCPTGFAVITPAFNLTNPPYNIKYIVHAVGPDLNVKGSPTAQDSTDLRNAYTQALTVAMAKRVRVIAFPCISTSIFGYPQVDAAPVAVQAVLDCVNAHPGQFAEIIFVCFLRSDYDIYAKLFEAFQASH
jgi:O-acetyl-ADP-ribose deacetylase (regulator of RNase III)